MFKNIINIEKIRNARAYNQVIYFLQRIPWLGKIVPDKLFNNRFVLIMNIFGPIFNVISVMLGVGLYLGIILIYSGVHMEIYPELYTHRDSFICFLLLFSVLNGAMLKINRFEANDEDDRLFIMLMHMEPRKYYLAKTVSDGFKFFLLYSVTLSLFGIYLGISLGEAMIFTIFLIGTRLLMQYVYVKIYRPNSYKAKAYNIATYIVIPLSFLALYLLLFENPLGGQFLFANHLEWMFATPGLIVGAILILVFGFLLSIEKNYYQIARQQVNITAVEEIEKVKKNAYTSALDVKDEDLKTKLSDDHKLEFNDSKGITYINQLFFSRMKMALNKKFRWYYLFSLIALVLVIAAVATFRFGLFGLEMPSVEEMNHFFLIPAQMIVLYACMMLNIGQLFTQFCFYNMDKYLLKLNFYREPKNVYEAMRIRFSRLMFYNLPQIVMILILVVVAFFGMGATDLKALMILLLVVIISMTFYGVHYLYMYYLIQPYTEEMEAKSPTFFIISFLFYYIPYVMLQSTDELTTTITFALFAFMVAYVVIGFILLRIFAPRNFKLRS